MTPILIESPFAGGEVCQCGRPAVEKVETVIDGPFHPLTTYVCGHCHTELMQPWRIGRRWKLTSKEKPTELHKTYEVTIDLDGTRFATEAVWDEDGWGFFAGCLDDEDVIAFREKGQPYGGEP